TFDRDDSCQTIMFWYKYFHVYEVRLSESTLTLGSRFFCAPWFSFVSNAHKDQQAEEDRFNNPKSSIRRRTFHASHKKDTGFHVPGGI
ncbi:MAG: hypothetical protein ACFFB3_11310, partial [Candidatus Hodarchaeota archaeon]